METGRWTRDGVSRLSSSIRSRIKSVAWMCGSFFHHTLSPPWGTDSAIETPTAITNSSPKPKVTPPFDSQPLFFRPVPEIRNPVLTARDITDFGNADGVADPFLFVTPSGKWHMFFEVFNKDLQPTAAIGHATSQDGGHHWTYDQIVLESDLHYSFPYVFKSEETCYMVPDPWFKGDKLKEITLFRAREFPTIWEPVTDIIRTNHPLHDCVILFWNDYWWALGGDEQNLYLFYSEELENEEWRPHQANPVVQDRPSAARPGGRPIVSDDCILMYFQDCFEEYGQSVRAYQIDELSKEEYVDHELPQSPVLTGGSRVLGWNSGKMHHVDAMYVDGKWLCAVDGSIGLGKNIFGTNWSIGIFEATHQEW